MDQENKQATQGLLMRRKETSWLRTNQLELEQPARRRGNQIGEIYSISMLMKEMMTGKQKTSVVEKVTIWVRNQLGNKLRAQKCSRAGGLLRVINKPAQLQTKAGKNRTRAEQISSRTGEDKSFERIKEETSSEY
ncbi:leucine-rich repeat receptor-like serine/threonine-protein kinase-like [Dorcoceras hygrometricum]|uniref:Leucine-rich repeat receptor-like serine/threonine-protein kinase-like n=1 Tax=Dorcoceras hygrometricum TaxID=472368 RepID=A0A2Z7BLE1_9LAMI|nr:leucine-rich repeat receptor-like serine/threonine-protein kinase-like [Dorcoceras hygrometricum]